MIRLMNVLPIVVIVTITMIPGVASAEEITQRSPSVDIVIAHPTNDLADTAIVAQANDHISDHANAQPAPAPNKEVQVAEVAQLPSKDATIQGKAEKRQKSTLFKIGSFLADVLFFGDYPDGYTSFVSP